MGVRQAFRVAHLLLLLAATLNLALLFAPVAYASNFRSSVYAEVYGSWVYVQEALTANGGRTVIWFYQDIFLFAYAALALGVGIYLLLILFLRKGDHKKMRILPTATLLQFAHLGIAILLYFHADAFVGEAPSAYLESSFQREMSLHLFIILFTWSARRRYRKALFIETAGIKQASKSPKINPESTPS